MAASGNLFSIFKRVLDSSPAFLPKPLPLPMESKLSSTHLVPLPFKNLVCDVSQMLTTNKYLAFNSQLWFSFQMSISRMPATLHKICIMGYSNFLSFPLTICFCFSTLRHVNSLNGRHSPNCKSQIRFGPRHWCTSQPWPQP